jgi:hypothetical protein
LSGTAESYFCNPDLVLTSIAEVAHLVEHDLAKVGVAGSSPVFRSAIPSVMRDGIFFNQHSCLRKRRPGGGTGRHAGLKILFAEKASAGSIPAWGTDEKPI